MDWTDEAVARMTEMREGGRSSTEIGRELGTTRNAVIGKCKRLGISTPLARGARAGLASVPFFTPSKTPRVPKVAPEPPAPLVFAVPHDPVPTIELKPNQCRYVVSGEDSPFAHCGRHADGVWCVDHRRVVYQPQKRAP